MSQLDQPLQSQPEPKPADDQPDWLKGFSNESESLPAASTEQPDLMSKLDQPLQASDDQLDWLKQLDQSEQPVPLTSEDQPDWLKGFGSEAESATAAGSTEPPDWLGQLGEQAEPSSPKSALAGFDFPAQTETAPEN